MFNFPSNGDQYYVPGSQPVTEGLSAQELFVRTAQKYDWVVKKSTDAQDGYLHIDYYMTDPQNTFGVDVKAQRRNNRNDLRPSTDFTWFEIQNVRGGKGSLFGKADYFAMEYQNKFVLFPRSPLKDFVLQNVKNLDAPKTTKDGLQEFEAYTRKEIPPHYSQDIIVKVSWTSLAKFYKDYPKESVPKFLVFET